MKTNDIQPELLKAQIEGFTDFEKTFDAGSGGIKKITSAVKAGSRDLWQIPPDQIFVMPGYNPRVQNKAYFEGVRSLAELIKEHGYYQDKPLSCYIAKVDGEDRIVLQDGHRRFAAAQLAISELGAPIKALPVVFKEKSESTIDLTLALLHSNEGQAFTTYEKAVIAKRLKKYGWTNAQIAAEFHVTPTNVGQLLTMASAPQVIVDLVQNGNMSATEAHRLLMENGAAEAERIASEGMAAATAAGRKKITQKDLSPSDQKAKNAKKHAYDLFRLLKKYRDLAAVEKHITDADLTKIDEMIADIEKKPKVKAEPKPKAAKKVAPTAKKAPAAAKKIAAKSSGKKGDESPEAFFERMNAEQAAAKAAKASSKGQSAQARSSVVPMRRSER